MRELTNTYFLMRHGRSKANEKGIILSHPEDGMLPLWGLTDEGIEQVNQTAANSHLPEGTIVYSSNFSRAWESASLLARAKNFSLNKTELLRERYFGILDKKADSLYQIVWDSDDNPDNHENDVESPMEVQKRTSSLVLQLERKYSGKIFVLVSHGDALQILQTWFLDKPPTTHRSLPHMETAELRAV